VSAYAYLTEVLADKYDVAPDAIRAGASMKDLGLDSLMVVDFLFEVEDHYDIEVPEDRVDFATLGDAAALIDELVAAKGG